MPCLEGPIKSAATSTSATRRACPDANPALASAAVAKRTSSAAG